MSTMHNLFVAAGYPDYEKSMIPGERYEIDKDIKIKSFDLAKKEAIWSPVEALYYKGQSDPTDTFKVSVNGKSFLCTGEHLVYKADLQDYSPARNSLGEFAGLDTSGNIVTCDVEISETTFPILDVEVKDTQCYFSAGILSHNSFGGGAKLMAEGLRKFNPILEKYHTSLIMISQERDNIGALYGPDYKVTGGRAIKFYASNRSRITRTGYIKEKGIVTGIEMRVKNGKNKAGIPYREAELTLMFKGGFDTEKEYMDFIVLLGIVEQRGAYFRSSKYDFNLQGRARLQEWLDEHPTEYEEIKKQVNQMLCGETVLDEDNEEPTEDLPVTAADAELSDGEMDEDEPPVIEVPADSDD